MERGLVTLNRDDFDGTIRQIYPGRSIAGTQYPNLSRAIANAVSNKNTQPSGRIAYFGDANSLPFEFPTYPAHSATLIPADWFKGKIVLIGSTLPTADLHRTPFSTVLGSDVGSLYGVVIHAHKLAQILQGANIGSLNAALSLALVLGLAMAAAAIVSFSTSPMSRALMITGLIMLGEVMLL